MASPTDGKMTNAYVNITLPYPPSVNTYWRTAVINGRPVTYISKNGKQYREAVSWECAAKRQGTMTGRLYVIVTANPPDRRERDLDNILKSLLDALQHGRIYESDGQIDRLEVTRGPIIKGGQVVVTVGPLD